ncbi:MAG: dual specificity protein phosphatase family protein [Solirubrobacterales bacterium]|nr:dual specificity protein phosphatase family protein [Solirubrobacterales bacterium]
MSRWFRSYGFAEVSDGLVVGAYPLDEADVATLALMGIKRVLNLTEDSEYRRGERESVVGALQSAGIEEDRLGFTDYGPLPAGRLDDAVRRVSAWLDDGSRTYVHCRAGWQRSAAVAAAVIAAREGLEIDDALGQVQRRKPSADPLPRQREDLRRWWAARRAAQLGGKTQSG